MSPPCGWISEPMNTVAFSPSRCAKCDVCAVHNHAICRVANEDAVRELNRISRLRNFTAGQVVMAQHENAILVGNVVSGILKLTNTSEDGHQQIVGLLYPSDFFGRAYQKETRFSLEAATDVTLCCMDRIAFEHVLARFPELEHELYISTLDEIDAMREWSALINGRTTMQRVATFLFILAKRSRNLFCAVENESAPHIIAVPISRRDFAGFIGTTPETLSRNIQMLARKRVIRILDSKHFELLCESELAECAGEAIEDLRNMIVAKQTSPQ